MNDSYFNGASRRAFFKQIVTLSASTAVLRMAPWVNVLEASELDSNASSAVRIGVIGVGSRGRRLLLSLLQIPNIDVVAVCDDYEPHYDRALIITNNKARGYRDYRRMLEAGGMDGIVIATPLAEHAHIAIDAMNVGVHVFCEKAMARTLRDTQQMRHSHERTGRILQIGHQRLFDPSYLHALYRVHSGEIGRVTQVRAFWHRNNDWRRVVPAQSGLEKKINWRLYRETSAGLMTELASHQIQVANWVFGNIPTRVMGSGSIAYWQDGREVYDHVALIYDYPQGRQLIYDSMINNAKYGLEEQILGDKGTIETEAMRIYQEVSKAAPGIMQLVDDLKSSLFSIVPIGGASWIPELASNNYGDSISQGYFDATLLSLEAFADSIRRNEVIPGLFREGYHATVAALLGEQAMDTGKAIIWPIEYVMSAEKDYVFGAGE